MDRAKITFFLSAILLLMLVSPSSVVWAAPEITGIEVQPVDTNTSDLTLHFSGTAPYTIYRSLDGQAWGAPLVSGYNQESWSDVGLNNFTNYYYKVIDATAVAVTGVAFPPNNDVHGHYARDSEACASCHVTHTAVGPKLLVSPTVVGLCTSCHDGTQSKYDVRNGRVNLGSSIGPSNAGPFGPLYADTGDPKTVVQAGYDSQSTELIEDSPTSIHNLGTMVSNAPGTISDRAGGLGCQDCHNPHGSENYRNLLSKMTVRSDLESDVVVKATAATDPLKSRGYAERITYLSGSVYFCSACHSDFNQTSGAGSNSITASAQGPEYGLSPGAAGKYMHPVNTEMVFDGEYFTTTLPMETGSGVNQVVCLTCHFAHGSSKSGISKRTNSTALIRLNDQGVCQDCHKR